MGIAKVYSVAMRGLECCPVLIELDLANGLPGFVTVGLGDRAVGEARSRVASAVRNSGFRFPQKRITVNLAPAEVPKAGAHFDLPIALAVLSASGQIPEGSWSRRYSFAGELALDGAVRSVPGALAMALEAKTRGFDSIITAQDDAVRLQAGGMPAHGVSSLREAAEFIAAESGRAGTDGGAGLPEVSFTINRRPSTANGLEDLSDVKGQVLAKRALEIAAAGGHNLLLLGPPGAGKSMLARRLATLLPELSNEEALEVTRIHALAGPSAGQLMRTRPFRAPHHTATAVSLVGGGASLRPGEASLAHGGVLFLDELGEFGRASLEALRQPLEDGKVTIARAREVVEYPARFMLAAATNPCPCGWKGSGSRFRRERRGRGDCECSPLAVRRYLSRLSGPLMDRIDLHVEMAPVEFHQWMAENDAPAGGPERESSAQVRARVEKARAWAARRQGAKESLNARIPAGALRGQCALDEAGLRLLERAMEKMGLSARGLDRVLRVARTIADLDSSDRVGERHLAEAVQFRSLDRRKGG